MSDKLRVLLVTTWETACGIAEYAAYLKQAVEAADPDIKVTPSAAALDPALIDYAQTPASLVHLNYQNALHSRWTPDAIRKVQAGNRKVLVTVHDTGVPNSDQVKAVVDASDYAVVHEEALDLPARKTHYWRQGVPERGLDYAWGQETFWKRWPEQPVVGTVGFPFPWKNYDLLNEAAKLAGWAVLIIAPGATTEQITKWQALNPKAGIVYSGFMERGEVVRKLAACDATAFLYVCHNTGTSGAIRQGIAARKPVLAMAGCRQFRDLEEDDDLGSAAIHWISNGSPGGVARALSAVRIQRVDPGIVALAERDSWATLGGRYARLYRRLVV